VTGRRRALTEYECGRAQMAIEWVARSQKPIVEIGGRPVKGCDFVGIAADLNRCIADSGEAVRGFVMPDRALGYCCYGFYRYPWAIAALLCVWGGWRDWRKPRHSLWIQGLLFGYSADAIQRFMSSASGERESTQRFVRRSEFVRLRKVEIYGTPARLVQRRNNLNGRFQRLD
jgi:hypothetical protein